MSDHEPGLAPGTLEGDKQLIAVLLAQFNACRAEIQARSGTQATLDNLNITATGIIGGYYFSATSRASELILLVIPLLSPMLGIIWADHAINIGKIGRFIQAELMPTLRTTLRYELPDYEVWVRVFEQQLGPRLVLLIAPRLLLYGILPAAAIALAIMAAQTRNVLFWTLVGIGAALIVIFGGYAILILLSTIWKDTGAAAKDLGS